MQQSGKTNFTQAISTRKLTVASGSVALTVKTLVVAVSDSSRDTGSLMLVNVGRLSLLTETVTVAEPTLSGVLLSDAKTKNCL